MHGFAPVSICYVTPGTRTDWKMNLNLGHLSDDELIGRVAWLYYVFGLNQAETATRLGLHRSRVNRLLAEGRDRGLIRVTINHDLVRDFEREQAIARAFKLDFCLSTPETGFVPPDVDPRARRGSQRGRAPFCRHGRRELPARKAGGGRLDDRRQLGPHARTGRAPSLGGARSGLEIRVVDRIADANLGRQPLRGRAGLRSAHGGRSALPCRFPSSPTASKIATC